MTPTPMRPGPLATQAVVAVELRRDVLRVSGPDAVTFLQGQLSQDVVGLAVGASAWSFLLQPQGKVDALVRISRVGADEVLVDTDGGWGERVQQRLQRFKLRVKADIEILDWGCVGLRGEGAVSTPPPRGGPVEVVVADASWPGLPGVDLLGPQLQVPEGLAVLTAADYEVARIEAGVPVMGAELDESTIPAEAGIVERTVSFTKGCYTGQELVARIDSRGGNVPRRLRGVVVHGGDVVVPAVLEPVVAPGGGPGAGGPGGGGPGDGGLVGGGGKPLGALTSAAWSPARQATVALAYVRRDVEPPVEAVVAGSPATVHELPLPPAR